MDSNNLATLFAPNILHSMKPGDGTISPGDTKQHQIFLGKNNLTLNFNQPISIPLVIINETSRSVFSESSAKAAERTETINIVRTLIDYNKVHGPYR